MIVFPNAKINLGLQVTAKRQDGYHDIATIFYPIPCTDVLEAVKTDTFSFTSSGLTIDAPVEKNLCVKAWNVLNRDHHLTPVSLHLHKNIPMGAGLGGGSADGAFTLILLNKLFGLELSTEKLISYALELGSDCPFFILNQPVFATGRGEILSPLQIPALAGKKMVLVNPGLHISTPWAFQQLTPKMPDLNLTELVQQPVTEWKGRLDNDFETVVFEKHPQLEGIRQKLYNLGALFSGMTGTGSTIYGIFDVLPELSPQDFPDGCRMIPLSLD